MTSIHLAEIASKPGTRHGRPYPGRVEQGARATIEPKKSIRLFGTQYPGTQFAQPYDVSFKIGDVAIYHSYNLSYLGTILAITEKSVTIRPAGCSRVRRLSIYDFNHYNYMFDLAKVEARNARTSQEL